MIHPDALALIISHEGLSQPWDDPPSSSSGVTIGRGYDLCHQRISDLMRDWSGHYIVAHLDRLAQAIGLNGLAAKAMAPTFRDLPRITAEYADKVLFESTLPRYEAQTARAFPGFYKLPPLAQGALVSLVYNRGDSMDGDRRREMRAIRDAVLVGDLAWIATELRRMKRLWRDQGLDGLITRREDEARLVELAMQE